MKRTWEPKPGDGIEGVWRKTCGDAVVFGENRPCIETDAGEMIEIPSEPMLDGMVEGMDPDDGDRVKIDYSGEQVRPFTLTGLS